jgi:hypothetical protein
MTLEIAYADGQMAALTRYKLGWPAPTNPTVANSAVLRAKASPSMALEAKPSMEPPASPASLAQNFSVNEQAETRMEPRRKLSANLCTSCRKLKHYGSCTRPVPIPEKVAVVVPAVKQYRRALTMMQGGHDWHGSTNTVGVAQSGTIHPAEERAVYGHGAYFSRGKPQPEFFFPRPDRPGQSGGFATPSTNVTAQGGHVAPGTEHFKTPFSIAPEGYNLQHRDTAIASPKRMAKMQPAIRSQRLRQIGMKPFREAVSTHWGEQTGQEAMQNLGFGKHSDFNPGMLGSDPVQGNGPATSPNYQSATSSSALARAPEGRPAREQAATSFADLFRHQGINSMPDQSTQTSGALAKVSSDAHKLAAFMFPFKQGATEQRGPTVNPYVERPPGPVPVVGNNDTGTGRAWKSFDNVVDSTCIDGNGPSGGPAA